MGERVIGRYGIDALVFHDLLEFLAASVPMWADKIRLAPIRPQ